MHELSIALSMIEMASEEAQRLGAARVNAIHLKIGALSGVVTDALLFSYEIASQGTLLEDSQLLIEEVPVVIYCEACQAEREVTSVQWIGCPACGQLSSRVVRGRELLLVSMEIEQPETEDSIPAGAAPEHFEEMIT